MANNNKHTGPNVPALRFPEISGKWEKFRVSDFIEFFPTNSLSWDQLEYRGAGLLNLHYGMIHNGLPVQVDASKNALPSIKEDFNPKKYTLCKEGDIAFADASEDTNDVGKAIEFNNCAGKSIVCGLHTIHGRDRLGLTSIGFKGYLFSSKVYHDQIKSIAQGTKVFSIKASNFDEVILGLPKIEEQKKISSLLMAIDDRILTQSKIIEELKTLRSALRYKLLDEMMVERTAKLGELCRITTGKLDANAMVEGGGYPFFTCAEQVYEIDRYAFDTEALLVSGNGANLGHIHYYCGKFNAYQRTYVLSDFSEDIQYLRQYLEAYLSKRIESEKNTGNTPYIVLGTLADMEIKLPKVPEQQRIAHDLSVLSQKIENETHMFKLFIQEKKTLLGKMFI